MITTVTILSSANAMQKVTPSPRTWTLRFKNQRSTILLEVDPLQELAAVRAELLYAITITNPSGKFNNKEIPRNPDHIKLGRAIDRNNLSLGYTSIDDETQDRAVNGKGKGKGKIYSNSTEKPASSSLRDCPQGALLRNGDIVAFTFKDEGSEEDNHDDTVKWEVIVPTMEETYGEMDQDEAVALEDEG